MQAYKKSTTDKQKKNLYKCPVFVQVLYRFGVFTDYIKQEIDIYTASVLEDFEREKQIEKASKHKWFFGRKK